MDIANLLETALMSPDAGSRNAAERQLADLAEHSFAQYMRYLAEILGSGAKPQVRMLAALGIKNQLTLKDLRKRHAQQARWVQLDGELKAAIKAQAVRVLLSDDQEMTTSISQVVSAIALVELPRNEWPELLPVITEHTKTEQPVSVKRACLLAIGYICESADASDPQLLAQLNGILIAIVQGVQATEPSVAVRLTALNALIYSLLFIKLNFQREGERNFIMQVVCEATQAADPELQAAAFACLARIVQLYYQHMSVYMEKALYALSIAGMQSTSDSVACMAIEFWSTICEEEFEIAFQLHELSERGEQPPPDVVSYNFTLLACRDVLPVLLTLLTKQNDDPDDDDWSVAMAAGSCLQLFATTTGMYVVEPTLSFFAANIALPEWRNREAAVMAFGSILEGPDVDNLKPAIQEAIKPIMGLISDPTVQVKETVTWCLGKIAEVALSALDLDSDLEPLLQALLLGLSDHPKVSVNCCWTLMNLLEQLCMDAQLQESSVMSKYYHTFVPALVQLSGKEDNEFNSRASAYEALSAFVTYSANDSMPIIQQIATEVLSRLEATIAMQLQSFGSEGRASLEELQINLLSLLTTTIRRLSSEVQGASDSLMTMFIKLLDSQEPNALIEEDIFIAISAVSGAVGPDFLKYMDSFVPYLTKALRNVLSPTCVTAVGFIADLAQSLGHAIAPFLEGLMSILGEDLNDKDGKRELKPAILSCFGDIAGVIGEGFMPYMEVVMQICSQLSTIVPEDSSYDSLEYVISVKEAVLDCYVGIVSSLSSNQQQLFMYLGPIFQLIEQISGDVEMSSNESTARSAVGLLGDIAAMYQDGQLKNYYDQPWVTPFIKKTRANISFTQQTKDAARWARDRQKRHIG
ncbi:ARM repeat-containing protein [Metschnikowia bicuspidata var. bicuspidata NRRL YB-4993]|uniref:Importin-95 n=1 Tax=Metschnikowia bicuspidata var. bicuspidata NRRL YB-4993 TaxID=869754 RepID=A0A1A0H8N3_9ASCO|nr:ARM repeat-containing protein [Metschnikowia bicuspidata var. bicuspidata NRRL YB-4993]OBA20355.1 ARM repeat-containing protein [Metschnikowia bicuspidata var. bicuspidata NRRL YB-4993]